MTDRVNLVDFWGENNGTTDVQPLQTVRLDANETAVVPFTTDGTQVKLHYCGESELRGYVHCNGTGCVLCQSGRKPDERVLLPVYLPASQNVGVLSVSPSSRPGALRPQIMPALRAGKRVALLISKADQTTFKVGVVELKEGMDDGAAIIKAFQDRWNAKEVNLTAVYPRLANEDLAVIPGIAAMLRLKGVQLHGHS